MIPLDNSEVREVPLPLAREIVERFEPMPAQCRLAYGIFFDGACGGVVVFSDEYAENLGVWDRYGFSGKIILLSRGVCLHWAPKNANSRLVRQAMRLLPPQYGIVTATTDATLGERGVIYRAAGVCPRPDEQQGRQVYRQRRAGPDAAAQGFGGQGRRDCCEAPTSQGAVVRFSRLAQGEAQTPRGHRPPHPPPLTAAWVAAKSPLFRAILSAGTACAKGMTGKAAFYRESGYRSSPNCKHEMCGGSM